MGQKENSTAYAVIQILNLYRVQYTREQSRTLNVAASSSYGRGFRPLFIGEWIDEFGKRHAGGKADFLARPRIKLDGVAARITVPLWIETKSIDGKMRQSQREFRRWVEGNGDTYLLISEDARPLLQWLEEHGVPCGGSPEKADLILSPMDASELDKLPCRWCGLTKEKHAGKIFSCPLHLLANDTRLIGKVWSPRLAKGAK